MSDAEAPPMHEDFARWYSAVSLADDPRRRQARWAGVSSVVRDADDNTVEGLLRLTHPSRHLPMASTLEAIRQAFKDTDDAFDMSGNDRELQILAAACLAVLMATDEHLGPVAALAATTTGLAGARLPDLPMNLAALAESEIVRWAHGNRTRPSLTAHFSSEPPRISFAKAAAKATTEQDWEALAEAFDLCANATHLAMKRFAKTQLDAVSAAESFLRVQDEELQMLWWLTGQRSSDCDCAFGAIPTAARPLVLAKELADRTEFLPGPPSVQGILSRAGLTARKKVLLTAAVNTAESNWLRAAIGESNPSPLSTPLHDAIRRQLETGVGDTWIAGWAASTGLDAAYALPSLSLANFFYRERLLLRFE